MNSAIPAALLVLFVASSFAYATEEISYKGRWRRQVLSSTSYGNTTQVDEICSKNPKGETASLCKQLEYYKTNSKLKPTGPVVAILSGDAESRARQLMIMEQRTELLGKAITGTKYAVQTIEKAAEFLEKLKNYTKAAQEVAGAVGKIAKTCTKALGALSTIASVCGPIGAGIGVVFSFISLFIPQPDPNQQILDEIKEGFDKMHERFDKLEWRLDQIEFTVEKTAVYQMYKENQDRIHKVMFAHRQLFLDPSELALREFIDVCRIENPLYALEWMHRRSLESRNPFGLQLFLTIIKDTNYDRKQLALFYEVITSDMMTAAYLREACLGAQSPGNTRLIWKSRRVTGNLLTGISKTMKYWDNSLANSFQHSQLKEDLQALLDTHIEAGTKNQDIVVDVKKNLKEKYYWLNWNVYLVKSDTFDLQDGGDGGHFAKVQGKKSKDFTLVLTWSESNQLINSEIDYCYKTYDKNFTENLYYLLVGFGSLSDPEFAKRMNLFIASPPDFMAKASELYQTTYHEAVGFKNRGDFRNNKAVLIIKTEHILANVSDIRTCDLQIPTRKFNAYITYYKSTTIPNTFGCLATKEQLDALNVTRTDVCPLKALQEAVNQKVKKLAEEKKWPQAIDASKDVRESLQKSYADLKWVVTVYDSKKPEGRTTPMPFWGCNGNPVGRVNHEYQNCTWLNTTGHTFVISWSFPSDKLMQKLINEADKKFKLLQILYEKKIIFDNCNSTDELAQHVHDLLTDPLLYFMHYAVSEERLADLIEKNQIDFANYTDGAPINPENVLNAFNYYENKVVTVGPSVQSSTPESIVLNLKLNPPQDKKHIQSLMVNINYYKPYEQPNTIHCTSTDKEYQQSGLPNKELTYGC